VSYYEFEDNTDVDAMSRLLIEEDVKESNCSKQFFSSFFLRNFYLKLWNDGNSCYCNSLVQALLSLNHKCLSRVSLVLLIL
jgi:uncharacterized UBP type Zn finger protein